MIKRLLTLILAFATLSLAAPSCQKGDEPTKDDNTQQGGNEPDAKPKNIIPVSSVYSLFNAAKDLKPGDVIELAAGTYKDVKLVINDSGVKNNTIEVRAADGGQVFITGDSKIELRGDYVELGGIYFKDGNRKSSEWGSHGPGLVAIYGDHCRVHDCLFYAFDTVDSAYITTSLDSATSPVPHYAHIERCAFIGKTTMDQVINLNNAYANTADRPGGEAMYHRINNCYFSNPKKYQTNNPGGGIRIGYKRHDMGRCLVDHNLFVRQNSETEIITSKSQQNVYYKNTFKNCQGTFNFRHGDKQVAICNYLYSTDTNNDYGGMYIWGNNHIVAGNYFNITRTLAERGNSAMYFNLGIEGELEEHALAHSMLILQNDFVNTNGTDINFESLYDRRHDTFGDDMKFPYGIKFVANRFVADPARTKGVIEDSFLVAGNQTWVDNIYNGMPLCATDKDERVIDGLSFASFLTPKHCEKPFSMAGKDWLSYLPYNTIEGVEIDGKPLDIKSLIDNSSSMPALTSSEVGPSWSTGEELDKLAGL